MSIDRGASGEDVPGRDEMFDLFKDSFFDSYLKTKILYFLPEYIRWVIVAQNDTSLFDAMMLMRYNNHFFNPDAADSISGFQFSYKYNNVGYGTDYFENAKYFALNKNFAQTNWVEKFNRTFPDIPSSIRPFIADFSWPKAIAQYKEGKVSEAYNSLGHVAHLLQDMGSPPHVRNDVHILDLWSAKGMGGKRFDEYAYEYYVSDKKLLNTAINKENWNKNNIINASIPDELFDGFAAYTRSNFFSSDTIDVNNSWFIEHFCDYGPPCTESHCRIYLICKLTREDDPLFIDKTFKFARLGLFNRYKYYLIPLEKNISHILDEEVYNDYWKILSHKTAVYTASLINLFQKEVAPPPPPPPAVGVWSPTTGPMRTARRRHTATLLPNGKVLVAGGDGGISTAELYDPATGTFSFTSSMMTARTGHTATLLGNGKVLIAGGNGGILTAELYDPATGTFSFTKDPMGTYNRVEPTATLLPNGKVLIAGGNVNPYEVDRVQLYDPAAGTF
jgi:hypothetical protein